MCDNELIKIPYSSVQKLKLDFVQYWNEWSWMNDVLTHFDNQLIWNVCQWQNLQQKLCQSDQIKR